MDRLSLNSVRALVIELEEAFQKDRTRVFEVLDQLRPLCETQPNAALRLTILEAVLHDYRSSLDDVFVASGGVISALLLTEETADSA